MVVYLLMIFFVVKWPSLAHIMPNNTLCLNALLGPLKSNMFLNILFNKTVNIRWKPI